MTNVCDHTFDKKVLTPINPHTGEQGFFSPGCVYEAETIKVKYSSVYCPDCGTKLKEASNG